MQLNEANVIKIINQRIDKLSPNKVPGQYRWATVEVPYRRNLETKKIVYEVHECDVILSMETSCPETDPRIPFIMPPPFIEDEHGTNGHQPYRHIVFRTLIWQWGKKWEILPDYCYEHLF